VHKQFASRTHSTLTHIPTKPTIETNSLVDSPQTLGLNSGVSIGGAAGVPPGGAGAVGASAGGSGGDGKSAAPVSGGGGGDKPGGSYASAVKGDEPAGPSSSSA